MRARNIKPGFFSNDLLAECQMGARVLFIGLWTIADREGRLVDRPAKIKAQILPFDNCNVDELLNELAEKHEDNNGPAFIVRYRGSDGHRYIQILNFKKHQNPHVNEASSEIPAPEEYSTSTVQTPGEHTTNPAESLLLNPESLKKKSAPLPSLFFDQVWALYPIHKEKQTALEQWNKGKCDLLFDKIRDAIQRQIVEKKAADVAGSFYPEFPYLPRWLKKKRWEDEVQAEPTAGLCTEDEPDPNDYGGRNRRWA